MGEYDEILGTLLIGVLFNTYLYGIVCCQYATYHSSDFKDPLRIKFAVATLFSLDTFQSLLMVYLCWLYLVEDFSHALIFTAPQWPCAFIPIGTAVTACVTHLFLGIRIHNMSKSKCVFGFVLVMTLAEFVTGVSFGIRMWTLRNSAGLSSLMPYVIAWLTIQTTMDIFVAGFISIFLHRHRTGYAKTDNVINRLIRGCIQTGSFSAMLAICGLVAFVVRPQSIFYAMFMIPIGRTYTTTLMDTLNIRSELKERLMEGMDPNVDAVVWPRNDLETSAGAGTRSGTVAGQYQLEIIIPKENVPHITFTNMDSPSLDEERLAKRSSGTEPGLAAVPQARAAVAATASVNILSTLTSPRGPQPTGFRPT